MDTYQSRKLARTLAFAKHLGAGKIVCTACNGSGRYDHTGSPSCSSCGGTGKMPDNQK